MGRKQNYPIQLTESERTRLQSITADGDLADRRAQRAQILLWADEGKQDNEIIQMLGCAPMTVANTRRRWVKVHRLEDLPRSGSKPMLTDEQKVILMEIAGSPAPDGHERWTTDLLAVRLVEMKIVDSISNETVRRMLHKTETASSKAPKSRPHKRQ